MRFLARPSMTSITKIISPSAANLQPYSANVSAATFPALTAFSF